MTNFRPPLYSPNFIRTMNEKAERTNGWAAMLGIIAAMGAYATTGQIIPGIWWIEWATLKSLLQHKVVLLWWASWPSVLHMLSLATSFLVSSDGVPYRSSISDTSNHRSSQKIMTYDWTLLQTLIFVITPYFLMLALASKDEDDDGSDGGMLQPAYMPSNWI